jgi:hypothetical protein
MSSEGWSERLHWSNEYLAMLAETARRTGIDVSIVQRVLDVLHEVAEERARERENG